MDTIAFLIADELMQQSVYTILHIYKDKLEAHDITTTVTIIDFPHLIDQARGLIRQGAKVIITNSGSHQILTKAIDNVPILCLFSSTNDALYTLRSIAPKYKQIHLLLNENFMFNKEACPEELRKKIVFYPRYSLDKTHLELLARVRQLPVTPDTAIVGCPLLPQIAYPSPMPIYSIRPSESTMLSVLLYAQELLVFQRKDNKQLSMMSSILSHVTDGIILYAKGGAISHINERAASFLGIPVTTKNMRDIFPDWTEGSSPSFHETILQRPPYTLIANSDFFLMDSRSQYILTIRDVTELQRLEKNIRYKLSKTGLTATHHFEDIKTVDEGMKHVIRQAEVMARYSAPILIQGESGTGRNSLLRASTMPATAVTVLSWPSTAPPCRQTSWKASSSAMSAGPLRAPAKKARPASLKWPTTGRYSSMKSTAWRRVSSRSSCASWKRSRSCASVRTTSSLWISASSRPAMPTSSPPSRPAASGATCSSASTPCA